MEICTRPTRSSQNTNILWKSYSLLSCIWGFFLYLRLVGIWKLTLVFHKRHTPHPFTSSYLKSIKGAEVLSFIAKGCTQRRNKLIPSTPTPPLVGSRQPSRSQRDTRSLSFSLSLITCVSGLQMAVLNSTFYQLNINFII